ncbi:PIR protein [Plasmodium vivax]|uniref:VIR protein n=1 Tax=Plasmodium vivax TaxID=5855 RepID=A0A564ZP12_PLAVI|nr:PIR protein [Plasmodium vivax]
MSTEKSCFHTNNKYLDYKCYNRLKIYFDQYGKSKENSKNFDKIIKSANISLDNNISNSKILQNLEQHLKGHGVFLKENNDECCKYINFWLNKEVKEKHDLLYNDSKFSMFQNFVKYFNHIEHSINSQRCLSNINQINAETFKRMSKLYELYEYFTELKINSPYTKYYPKKTKCYVFGELIGEHNRYLADYEATDPDLIERLMNLKKLIENANIEIKEQCYHKTSLLHKSQLEIKLENEEIQRQKEELEKKQQEETRRREEENRRQEETMRHLEEAKRATSQQRITSLQLGNDVLHNTGDQEYQITNEIQRLKDDIQPELERYRQSSQVRRDFANNFRVQSEEENELQISSSDSPEHNWNSITDTQGTMGKITGAITDVFRSVEPAPILGVSGGMGALFLLFKYTPVGSFFGGRRGRFRQIPRSFNGPFPGDFTNFQEYGGGFVGYSPMDINPLAE